MSKIIAEDFNLKKEDKKNFKKSVIERMNLTNQFTIEDIENHKAELEKSRRELNAQIRVSKSVVENVERNHPIIATLTPEQLNAAHYLSETKEILAKSEAKLKEVSKTEKRYEQVLSVIYRKFGFVESNIIPNEQESNKD
jgi:regulator of sirC expression with transglutaminase-like and TPR domain